MNKQPEVTDATRAAFVEVFCALYKDNPIEKITVTQIVRQTGYSRATFYHYFHDVYEVLEYVEDSFLATMMGTIRRNLQSGQPLDRFAESFIGLIQKERKRIDLFLGGVHSSQFLSKLMDHALPVLMEAFAIGSENPTSVYALKFYIAGLSSVLASWLRADQTFSIEMLADLIKGILEDGVLKQLSVNSLN
ncbi:MAG: TetR/AcrR family transcriptional regulator [Oscillospiraceae bacterium]|nr:TetR/AcrR family transcriptional regulator [Oscillospiraceae bacterium]